MWTTPSRLLPADLTVVIAVSPVGLPYLVMRNDVYWHEVDASGRITKAGTDAPYLWTHRPRLETPK